MRYYLDPFGCVKNQVDAENMMLSLNASGWESAPDADDADLIIVNSCGFIESAKKESINAVLGWRKLYPGKKILLAGCLAQRYGKDLAEALPEADLLFGNTNLTEITKAAAKVLGKRPDTRASRVKSTAKTSAADENPDLTKDSLTGARPLLSLPGSAYVKISEGCNNRCSFCAIPLIRGNLKSRTIPDILEECKTLLKRGIKELCLIGQDLGSFGMDLQKDKEKLSQLPLLLEKLSKLKGEFWVRLLYIHPDNFPFPILDLMEKDERFLPYFDIPFQHGSETMLKTMNRHGDTKTYLGLIKTIRTRLPDSVLRSTFMTGFPGETEEHFAALLDFQEKLKIDWLGCFAYSREEDTPAYSMKGRVAKKIAAKRKSIIEEKQIPISEKQMDRFVGREFACLVEEKVEGEEGLYLGRLPCQAPDVDGSTVITSGRELKPGSFVKGRVFARAGIDLELKVI